MPKTDEILPPKPGTAVIYARQSIEHSTGIDNQVALCQSLCARNGWEVVRIYKDNDVSAYKSRGKGTAWAAMISEIDALGIENVVATNTDRLLRRVEDLIPLTATNANLVTVDGIMDLKSAEGNFRATIGAVVSQFETKRKSERQVRSNNAKSSKGIPVPTRRRYGYETDGCTPRPSEAKEVKRLFEEFADGASIRSLALDMQKRGVDPGNGKGWPINRIRGILNNVFYGGQIIHRGVISDSEVVQPIVPKELALDVRAILADPARRTSPGGAIKHLLTGLIYCGVCGETLHHMTDYKCSKAMNHVQIKKFKIEQLVMWEVYKWASQNVEPKPESAESDEIRALMLQSREILDKILEQQEMATWNGADKATIKSKIAKLGKERDDAEAKIESLRSLTVSHSILRKVRLAWNAPIDAKGFAEWQKAMKSSADLMGWGIEDEDISADRYAAKLRIERSIEDWPLFWAQIPMDQKREIIRGALKITLNKGTSLDRVHVEELY